MSEFNPDKAGLSDAAIRDRLLNIEVPDGLRQQLMQIPQRTPTSISQTVPTSRGRVLVVMFSLAVALSAIAVVAGALFGFGVGNRSINHRQMTKNAGQMVVGTRHNDDSLAVTNGSTEELLSQLTDLETQKARIEDQIRLNDSQDRIANSTRDLHELKWMTLPVQRRIVDDQMTIAIYCASQYAQTLGLPTEYSQREWQLIVDHFPTTTLSEQLRRQLGDPAEK